MIKRFMGGFPLYIQPLAERHKPPLKPAKKGVI